jgi:hypothetical protein
MHRNGCAEEVSKKLKGAKIDNCTYKGNNWSEREAGHGRHLREEKTTKVWLF